VIGHVSYLDIHPQMRAQAAKKAKERIRGMMTEFLTPAQMSYLNDKLELISKWELGLIEVKPIEDSDLVPVGYWDRLQEWVSHCPTLPEEPSGDSEEEPLI